MSHFFISADFPVDSYELENRIQLVVETAGFRLLSALWKPLKGRPMLRVVADAEDHNLTINECARISGLITDLLDSYPHDFPDYRLEVSSPGLGHPLERWQFLKNVGRMVEVQFQEESVQRTERGVLAAVAEESLTLNQKGASRRFPYDGIQQVIVLPQIGKK